MLKKLYDTIKGEGYYTKSYEEFQDQYKDDKYIQKVFDTVSEEGLYTNSFEEFKSKYTIDPPKKKTNQSLLGGKKILRNLLQNRIREKMVLRTHHQMKKIYSLLEKL